MFFYRILIMDFLMYVINIFNWNHLSLEWDGGYKFERFSWKKTYRYWQNAYFHGALFMVRIGFNTKMLTSYYWNDYEPTLPMLNWGPVAHMCISKLLVVQVRPGLWQCPITNALGVRHCLWWLGPLGIHFNEILIKMNNNKKKSVNEMHVKIPSNL